MMQKLTFLVLFILVPIFFAYPILSNKSIGLESIEWPLYGYKVIDTHRYYWKKNFFAISDKGELIKLSFPKDKLKKNKIYDYSKAPDIIKHFTLKSGDLFVAIFKKSKKIRLNAFSLRGKKIYDTIFNVGVNIELADIRVNEEGKPLCLLYYHEKYNYTIGLWKDGVLKDIYRIENPIDYMFFQWKNKRIHMLHQLGNHYYWSVWSKGYYYQLKLPFHILAPRFFAIGRKTFLLGIDLSGVLWRFNITHDKLFSAKLISNRRFRYAHQIIPVVHKKIFNLFVSSHVLNKVWRIKFSNFFRNIKIGNLRSNTVLLSRRINLLSHKNKLHILMEISKNHLYLQSWNSQKLHLYNFKWRVNLKSPPSLNVSWKTHNQKQYLYQYLLDNNDNSEPVGELISFPRKKIKIMNVRDGYHIFHLQAIDPITKKKSYLYHIPIFWLYEPPEPQVIFLNTVSPSTFLPGLIKLYIKNQLPIDYYVNINQRSEYEPRKMLAVQTGIISLKINLKIGWYYLHIQARDPKSKKKSTVLHIPFSIKPYDPNVEHIDPNADTIRVSLEELKKKVIKNKNNVIRLKNIRRQLEKLEKKLIK